MEDLVDEGRKKYLIYLDQKLFGYLYIINIFFPYTRFFHKYT